jgi:hypothetical protein
VYDGKCFGPIWMHLVSSAFLSGVVNGHLPFLA